MTPVNLRYRGLARTPGLRVPGAISGFELALRAVLGQQISVQAATTIFGRFVETFGSKVETPFANIDRIAPEASDVANASLQQLIDRGLTPMRPQRVNRALILLRKVLPLRIQVGIASSSSVHWL